MKTYLTALQSFSTRNKMYINILYMYIYYIVHVHWHTYNIRSKLHSRRMYYNICYIVIKNAKRKLHTLCKCKNTATYTAWRGTWKATACGSKIFSLVKILVHY